MKIDIYSCNDFCLIVLACTQNAVLTAFDKEEWIFVGTCMHNAALTAYEREGMVTAHGGLDIQQAWQTGISVKLSNWTPR